MTLLDSPTLTKRPQTAGTRVFMVPAPSGFAAVDTVNIQNSCDLAAAAGGGVIQLDVGTYLIQAGTTASMGGVRLQDHCRLQGRGMGITILQVVAGTSTDITGVVRTPSGVANVGVQVADLTIDGNSANVSGTPTIIGVYCGVTPQSTSTDLDILFERVESHHCTGYGFDPHERTTRLRIFSCTAHDNGTDGFTLDGCYDFLVQNCISYSNTRHGFNFVTASQLGRVTGCDSYSNGSGGYVAQNGAKQIAFTGCQARANTSEGFVLNGVAQTTPQLDTLPGGYHTLTGCMSMGNGTHGYHLVGATGCRISGCQAQDNSQTSNNSSHHYYLDESGSTFSTFNVISGCGWTATSGLSTPQPKYGIAESTSNDGPNLIVGNTGQGHITADLHLLNAVSSTQAAHNGSTGTHPATFAYAFDSPSKHGYLEWNYDPISAAQSSANSTALVSGTLQVVKITPQSSGTVSNIIAHVLTAGTTLTAGQCFAAIYDSSGNRIGVTADQATAWGSTGLKTMALTAGASVTAGQDYFVVFLANGTAGPKFAQTSHGSFLALNGGLSAATDRFATNATAQTSAPSTMTLSSNSGTGAISIWCALS